MPIRVVEARPQAVLFTAAITFALPSLLQIAI